MIVSAKMAIDKFYRDRIVGSKLLEMAKSSIINMIDLNKKNI